MRFCENVTCCLRGYKVRTNFVRCLSCNSCNDTLKLVASPYQFDARGADLGDLLGDLFRRGN